MRLFAVAAAVVALVAPAAPAAAGTTYIGRTAWVSYDGLATLRVYPTAAGREVAADFGKTAEQTAKAWSEVLALAPAADTPGMRAQFLCHWNFAEFAQPGKTSWDLEPWRPPVGDAAMIRAGCNPGGAELG